GRQAERGGCAGAEHHPLPTRAAHRVGSPPRALLQVRRGVSDVLATGGMIMRGQMHHLDLTVSDLGRSRPFYDLVLGFLGYRRMKSTDDVVVWDLKLPDGVCGIAIRPAERRREHDRYTAGLHHFAWNADSRQSV